MPRKAKPGGGVLPLAVAEFWQNSHPSQLKVRLRRGCRRFAPAARWPKFFGVDSGKITEEPVAIAGRSLPGAFSSEVDTGSRQENASNQQSRAPFRFNRNGALGRTLWGGLDQGQFGRRHAGFQKSLTVMGDVSRSFPAKISQMPFDGQRWIAGEQDLGRLCRFLGSSELRQRGGPYGEHLKMIGIQIERFARPGQRRIILSQQIMAERVHGR